GIFVQRVYLEAAQKGLGVTGIGAYYDLKLQQFLGTDEAILYVAAIGAV
ncbi:MAG TPA: SagB/ThcOx family dehydrogenase, partial [Epsilonproteobacteria bacterium]|nr:SagB/ThcOx family dehydrogenase [Campylobacterota bacterium]